MTRQKLIKKEVSTKKTESKTRTWKQQKAFQKKKTDAVRRKRIAVMMKKYDTAKKARALKIKKAKAKKLATKKSTPKVIKKIQVGSLLTEKDLKYMQTKSMATIAVRVGTVKFMCSKQHIVSNTAKIIRDGQGQVTGMKAIASG